MTSPMAAHKNPQSLLCSLCPYVWDPKGFAAVTSGGPDASDGGTLDPNSNPTSEGVQVSVSPSVEGESTFHKH